jgi:glycosyltransferase involved in cell wall biosynthesis
MAVRISKVPCVVHIRQEIEPIRIPQYWLKKPQRLIAVSYSIKKVAVEAGVEASKITVVHSGIDTSMTTGVAEGKRVRDYYGLLPGQPVIGTVGNIFPRKGYEYLIEAVREIQKELPHIPCLLIGEGNLHYRELLLERIEKAGLQKAITFTGFRSEVLAYIAAMDVFVLPSLMEGFGIVLLEAMMMERPVVATAVGGLPEIVEDQATGFLVPPGNSSALAEKILSLLRGPAIRERLGQAGRARVLEHFSIDRMISQLRKLYGELAV